MSPLTGFVKMFGNGIAVETALNAIWLLAGLLSLSALAVCEFRRRNRGGAGLVVRRTLALVLAIFSLFPCVSASDDELRFHVLFTPSTPGDLGEPGTSKADIYLARVLEALEHFQIAAIFSLCLAVIIVAIVRSQVRVCRDRKLPSRSGRAPPSFAF